MLRLTRRLITTRPLFASSMLARPGFSSGKQPQNEEQPASSKPDTSGISLKDMTEYLKKQGRSAWDRAKKAKWYEWTGLGCIAASCFFMMQPEEEMYGINLFEDQVYGSVSESQNVFVPKLPFSEVTIVAFVHPAAVYHKIKFIRNNVEYTVNYKDQAERFERVRAVLERNPKYFNLKYHYQPSLEVKTEKIHIFFNMLSIIFVGAYFLRSHKMTSVKKSSGKSSNLADMMGQKKTFQIITQTQVRFKDVAGLDESKVEVQQFVDFLKNPQKYKKLGARIPKGVLLSGPPGTGKTMLAKACAGQAGVPFIPVSGSDFVEIFVGVGASRVRDLFATAKQNAPAIIFIDEIDAVGRKRSGSHGSHDERDNTLNQILVEMDGFETDKNVIVMAATNRQNLLDTALIRPGRFDRLVEINLPDLEGRRQIFNVHLKKIKMQSSRTQEQYARRLATLTPGFSGAQIANLCNQAAILAARNGKSAVDSQDLEMATERIIGGVERKSLITAEEKKVVAVHESGHAVVSWFLKGADPLLKLTIIPRSKGSLGFAQYFVNETKLQTKSQILDRICFILGGRMAEEKFFGRVTNGAADDLRKAYELAHSYVVKLGMSEELGLVAYKDPEFLRPYSEEMGSKIDNQIKKIIKECTEITRRMVAQHQHHIKNLSDELFQKQTLTIRQIRKILGERDFTSNETYQKYLQIEKQLQKASP